MIDFNSQLAIIPKVYETAQLQDDLEHSGGVTISWKSAESTEIPLGSYITYNGMRYILLEPYAPTKSGIHYQYSPMFKHPQNMLDRVPFWITSRDASGNIIHLSTTSFTGTPFIIIKKICDFMAEYANEMQDDFFAETVGLELTDPTQPWNASTNPWKATWTFDDTKITDTSKTIITVGFDGSSLKSAADAIASAMGCNVYWDWSYTDYEEGGVIVPRRTIRFISGTTITGDSYNCFHVLGGTTNMGKNTVSGGYAAVTQRMTLPDSHVWNEGEADEYTEYYPGSIIDRRPVDGQGRHYGIRLTKDLILDDIYPKMELYIKTARERLCILTDNETGDFIVDHFEDKYYYMSGGERVYTQKDHTTGGKDYDADGHELTKVNLPVYKTFAKWYVTFEYADGTPYVFDQRLLINDQPLGVLFQMDLKNTENMSTLVGNQFNATYFPTSDEEWAKNDALSDFQLRPSDKPWEIEAGEFYLNFEAEGETILPSTSDKGMYPEVGKKVTLVNVALTTEEATAKEELLDAAMEIIGLMNTPAGEYSEPVIFAEPISGVQPPHTIEPKMVGDDSPFGNTHGPVVTNVDLNIDTNEATVTVGSWSRKTKTGGTADKVETVSVSAASATNGSDPYSTGDLGEGHYVPKTSSSSQTTIAQTQVKPSGAFVVSLTPDNQTIDCNASGIVKTTKNIYIQIAAYYGSRDVTAGCRVAYTQALPQSVKIYLQASGSGESGTEMDINRDYDLTNGLDWLRINIPQGTNFSTLSGVLARTLDITHSAYGSRNVAITISGIYDGAAGMAGAFKSRVFARTNVDISRVRPTGGDYDHPWVGGENPCTQPYIIDEQTGQTVNVTWSDGIPSGDAKLWSTVCTFLASGTSGEWSNPAQETDTATIDLEFSPNATCPANAPVGTAAERNSPSSKAQRHQDGWYDPSDELPQGTTWEDMIWRAERAIVNGVYSGEWVITRIKGEAGNRGGNTATVYLYQRKSTMPTGKPGLKLYYQFSTKKLYTDAACEYEVTDNTSNMNNWKTYIPDGTDDLWVTSAIAFSQTDVDDIDYSPNNEWVTPAKLVINGADGTDGTDGINTAPVFLYCRAASQPTKPQNTVYYKFADGKLYTTAACTTEVSFPLEKTWFREFPTSDGKPCWVVQAAALSNNDYDPILTDDWSGVKKMVKDGTDGAAGVAGAFKSRVFVRTNTDLSTAVVTGGTYDRPYPTETKIGSQTVSVSWQDGIPQGDAKLWSTVRTFHADNRTTPWSSPSQETDTQTQDIEFAFAQSGDAQPAEPNYANRHGGSGTQIWFDPVLDAEGVPGSGLPSDRHWNEMVWRAEMEIKNGSSVGGWVITRIKGEAGNRGGNTATVNLYRRFAQAPKAWDETNMPANISYYKFQDHQLYQDPDLSHPFSSLNGWKQTIPDDSTDPIYITNAIAFNTAESDEIGTTEWVTPVKYTENGVNGSNGINAAAVFLYQRSASKPTGNKLRPSVDLYYKFADGKLYTDGTLSTEVKDGADVLCGWQRAFPASNGQSCWVIQVAALSANAYDEIEDTEWSTPVQMVKDGTDASNDDNTIMGLLGELASTINPLGFLRDSSYTLIISETQPAQPANDEKKIWYKPSVSEIKTYYNRSWKSIGSTNGNAIRILGEIVGFIGNEHTFNVKNSDNSTTNPAPPSRAKKYDIYTKSSKFTDKFTNQSITGGLGVWVFDGEVWQMVKDNVQGLLENYGDHIVNAVFGTDPSGSVNYASWMMTAKNFAEMVASATGLDDDKALASVRAICELDSQGKPTGTVEIKADLIDFDAANVNVKGSFQTSDGLIHLTNFGTGSNTYTALEINDGDVNHPYVQLYNGSSGGRYMPTLVLDRWNGNNGEVTTITCDYVESPQFSVRSGNTVLDGVDGGFMVGSTYVEVNKGIITRIG